MTILREGYRHNKFQKWSIIYQRSLSSGHLDGFLSPTNVVGVVFLLISSGVIIVSVAASFVLVPIVLPIHYCHLSGQLFILILKLSDHSI